MKIRPPPLAAVIFGGDLSPSSMAAWRASGLFDCNNGSTNGRAQTRRFAYQTTSPKRRSLLETCINGYINPRTCEHLNGGHPIKEHPCSDVDWLDSHMAVWQWYFESTWKSRWPYYITLLHVSRAEKGDGERFPKLPRFEGLQHKACFYSVITHK